MSQLPLSYRVVGTDDYMRVIDVDAQGGFRVDCGDHASHKPRQGRLSAVQLAGLAALVDRLGEPRERPAPEGAAGFMAELKVGSGADIRLFRFWEGALEQDPELHALVRGLDSL